MRTAKMAARFYASGCIKYCGILLKTAFAKISRNKKNGNAPHPQNNIFLDIKKLNQFLDAYLDSGNGTGCRTPISRVCYDAMFDNKKFFGKNAFLLENVLQKALF